VLSRRGSTTTTTTSAAADVRRGLRRIEDLTPGSRVQSLRLVRKLHYQTN